MSRATITKLPDYWRPYAWSLKIKISDGGTFHSFIDALKENVCPSDRKYDAENRRWLFCHEAMPDVFETLDAYGIGYDGANTPPPPPPGLVNRQIALTELFLLPNAPADVITAVFRVLAKKYHPDMGGSTEKMQRLNAAMEVLK
jgi:hypothetical protein